MEHGRYFTCNHDKNGAPYAIAQERFSGVYQVLRAILQEIEQDGKNTLLDIVAPTGEGKTSVLLPLCLEILLLSFLTSKLRDQAPVVVLTAPNAALLDLFLKSTNFPSEFFSTRSKVCFFLLATASQRGGCK